jgi:hypothetical protein
MVIWFVLALGMTACGGSADEGATTEAPTSTETRPTGVADEESALAVIDAAYELYDSGDLEGWIDVRNRGSHFATEDDRQEILDWERDLYGGEMEGGARYGDVECVSEGLGEWPIADTGPVVGYYFACDAPWTPGSQDLGARVDHFEWVVSEGPNGTVVAVRTSGSG